jgi:GT2 family glycosyltransferase
MWSSVVSGLRFSGGSRQLSDQSLASATCPDAPASGVLDSVAFPTAAKRLIANRHVTNVPNIVHFVFGLKDEHAHFGFINYAAVMSALRVQRPERILLHYHFEPRGLFWDLVRPYVELHRVAMIDSIFGNPVKHYAHKADLVRLQALLQYGGIYLDMDVITLRPYDDLMSHEMVMGQEGENGFYGLTNAVILGSPQAPFLIRWLESYRQFNDKVWGNYSVLLPRLLSEKHPDEITVLPHTAFFWPLWTPEGLKTMFRSYDYSYTAAYAVHLWNTASGPFLEGFSMQWPVECRSTLLSMLRTYVPQPLFTVVMPCFNQKHFIIESIEAVLAQTFWSWELLVVDDVSPDGCGAFVSRWFSERFGNLPASQQPAIRVIYNSHNMGLAQSRNNAILEARGHFICALDADDKISPDYFNLAQAAVTADPTINLVYSDQQYFGETSGYWSVDKLDSMGALIRGPLPVMSLYRRSLWERVGGYSSALPRGNEDYDFWLKLIGVGIVSHKLEGVHTFYRYKRKSMMRDGEPLRDEELALMHMRHPQLYHPASLLADYDIVGRMAPQTVAELERRLDRGVWHHVDDRTSTALWLSVHYLDEGDLQQADMMLGLVESAVGDSLVHRRVGWQALFLRARWDCASGRLADGAVALEALREAVPSIVDVAGFERQQRLCDQIAAPAASEI